jgi:hypothetical protein
LTNNQAKRGDHTGVFALDEGQRNAKHHSVTGGTTGEQAVVPQQLIDSIKFAVTVRECVREWKSGEHAN